MPPCKSANLEDYDAPKEEVLSKAEDDDAMSPSIISSAHQDTILKGLYLAVIYFCYSMVIWILLVPASWLYLRSRFHREVIIPYLEQQDIFFLVLPTSIITKYQDHDLVHFTHILPSAIWAAIVPFQLHPTWRTNHPQLHKRMGYVLLACTFLVSVGVFIIVHRKLTYENFFEELEHSLYFDFQKLPMAGMTLWYAYTALKAVQMAQSKQFVLHQRWMYRHVASGIWIAVQRLVCFPIAIAYYKITATRPSQWAQREIFSNSALLSWVVCVYVGEYAHKRVAELAAVQAKKKKLV